MIKNVFVFILKAVSVFWWLTAIYGVTRLLEDFKRNIAAELIIILVAILLTLVAWR